MKTTDRKNGKRYVGALAALLAVCVLIAGASVKRAYAYFTTYATAKGGYVFADNTQIEEYVDSDKHIKIRTGNTPATDEDGKPLLDENGYQVMLGTTPIYVRAKAIVAKKYSEYVGYNINAADSQGGTWTDGGDGWYYFTRVLSGVDETTVLDVTVTAPKDEENQQSFNIVVAYEKTPAIEGMDYKACWAAADATGGE